MIIYILYIILSPLLWILLFISLILNKKIRLRFFSYSTLFNHTLNKISVTNKKVILFHAASNGELEQLKPIFRKIDRDKYFILLTISSPSCIDNIYEDEIDSFCYQAFDFPWSVYNFLNKIKPEKYIITRHDIWPNHIIISKILSIESYLINANLPKSSKRIFPVFKLLSRFLFNYFSQIYTVSKEMGNRIKKLLKEDTRIKILGDTRFDQIQHRKNSISNHITLPKQFQTSKNILFGSIESRDIDIIFDALNNLRENFKINHINFIFVPHEPEENILINLESRLKELDIKSRRYSNMIDQNANILLNDFNALLIDSTGILADLYKYSSVSYIGCGFGKGVHNVAEPAIYGNTICFGPRYHILNEAIEMAEQKIAFPIENFEELSRILNMVFDEKTLGKNSKKISKYIELKVNFTETIINEIF